MSESQPEEYITKTIGELTPFDRKLQVTFVVIDKGETRSITSKKTNEEHELADIKVGDNTGNIILTLWDDTIDKVTEGETYVIKNSYVNVFQEHMRLALGKWGTLEDSEEKIELDSVNMENDRSSETHQGRPRRRRYGGRRDDQRSRTTNDEKYRY